MEYSVEAASSTFSFKLLRSLLVGCFSLSFLLFISASWLAEPLGNTFSSRISARTDGRVQNPVRFVSNRIVEVSGLLGCLGLGTLVLWCSTRFLGRIRLLPLRIVAGGSVGFAAFNFMILCASKTLLFWLGLYVCHPIFKETSFHIERLLLAESDAKYRIALIGSSQAASEFDSGQLTSDLYPYAQVGTLHHAGAHASDFLIFFDYIQSADASEVICYVSEQSFYTRTSGHIFLPLSTSSSLKRMEACGSAELDLGQPLMFSRLARLLPAFRIRRAVQSALGGEVVENGVRTQSGKIKSITDLAAQEESKYDIENSLYEKRCFRYFLKAAAENGIHVIIVMGQVNPVLQSELDSELREDFQNFLGQIEREFPEVEILKDGVKSHSSSEYSDLMHVREKTKTENTARLAEKLPNLLLNKHK